MSKKLKVLLFLVVLALLVFSIIYTKNLRISEHRTEIKEFERKTKNTLGFCLNNAVWQELFDRFSLPETNSVMHIDALIDKVDRIDVLADTSFVTRTIETMDTTFQVRVRKDNLADHLMISQFIMKKQNPVNLEKLEYFLRDCLKQNLPAKEYFIEYIDLKNNKVLNQSEKDKPIDYIASDIQPLDITTEIGIKAYIVADYPEFWDETMKDKVRTDIIFGIFIFSFLFGFVLFGNKIFSNCTTAKPT